MIIKQDHGVIQSWDIFWLANCQTSTTGHLNFLSFSLSFLTCLELLVPLCVLWNQNWGFLITMVVDQLHKQHRLWQLCVSMQVCVCGGNRSVGTWGVSLSISVANGIDRFVVDCHGDSQRVCLTSLFFGRCLHFKHCAAFTQETRDVFFPPHLCPLT